MSRRPIPDHVAAYAAALHRLTGAHFSDIKLLLLDGGFDWVATEALKRAALKWEAKHVAPEGVAMLDERREANLRTLLENQRRIKALQNRVDQAAAALAKRKPKRKARR